MQFLPSKAERACSFVCYFFYVSTTSQYLIKFDSYFYIILFHFKVGDNQCLLQSLKDSPYYKGFEDKASLWETRLADLDEYLHNLNQIQRKWVYLEPIFGRGALPREQGRFKRVDDDFRFVKVNFY